MIRQRRIQVYTPDLMGKKAVRSNVALPDSPDTQKIAKPLVSLGTPLEIPSL
jgi:hypothetical protein